ncbi:unnamed protein product [Zymoseptoria tritici ST99CH_1A5]|uniref:tripeptidyl-peptidase II n=2 Tax=Zymoseptoria tritici TaxID=1047171 RepID=F9XC21_ZYMTI|nr:uncharacterized protein MYCGRDRAFT_72506 [Zymoseptoria tritici IPO323]EGP87472.1 hypothetical protein MYCGRDRAFT_72506 [Zymoseptoria tritici IPO323]SMR54619.1 unnamed protein product [Zymoseptoria tritici ST99CH_3D1]SMY24795.1 unnamed protein product [Zymoseptoria tritici ST99CH_1A5]
MRFSSFAALAALASAVVAAPVNNFQRHVLHERREVSHNWVKRDRVHSDVKLPMRIGLVQSNLDNGHDLLMQVSDPDSKSYGKFYSAEEVHDLFAPVKDSVDAVKQWLTSAGIEAKRISQSVNKQWMQLDLSASEAEQLLQTKYHFYDHPATGKTTIGCDEYHVHENVAQHVDYITPGIRLLSSRSVRADSPSLQKRTFGFGNQKPLPPLLAPLPQSLESLLALPLLALCDVAITPECINAMYNITKATSAVPGNELGIFEDLGDVYAQEDLNLFFLTLQQRIPIGTHPKLEAIDGAQAPATVLNAGPESDLDFQISYPIIWPQNSVLFQTDDPVYEANYTYEGFLNNFLDAIDGSYCTYSAFGETGNSPLDPPYPNPAPGGYKGQLQCGVYKPTNVISISYGGQENDLPASYQQRQCSEFMKLGMQGVSVLVASGDSGVAGPAGDNSTHGCLNGGKVFSPDFPATCPYLTTVGATVLTGNVKKDEERAVTRFPSGGGFSNIYPIPDYQKSAVANYFATSNPPYKAYSGSTYGDGIYNRTGRGYPDVSAVGDNVVIFNKGAPTIIGGTSASCPVFAAILTRINDERLKVGKSTVGFVNPTLYKNPQVLHDITVGSNPGCGTDGFAVAKGWDPVTGLGTPNYPAMLKLFLAQS